MVAQVFSFFEYSSQCSKRTLRLPMEPLVGMMRHPFVIPICRPEVRHRGRTLTMLPLSNPGSAQTCFWRLANAFRWDQLLPLLLPSLLPSLLPCYSLRGMTRLVRRTATC